MQSKQRESCGAAKLLQPARAHFFGAVSEPILFKIKYKNFSPQNNLINHICQELRLLLEATHPQQNPANAGFCCGLFSFLT